MPSWVCSTISSSHSIIHFHFNATQSTSCSIVAFPSNSNLKEVQTAFRINVEIKMKDFCSLAVFVRWWEMFSLPLNSLSFGEDRRNDIFIYLPLNLDRLKSQQWCFLIKEKILVSFVQQCARHITCVGECVSFQFWHEIVWTRVWKAACYQLIF